MTDLTQNEISIAAGLIASSSYFVAFTGAGISTPSGIPDFRSKKTGLWVQDDPLEVASATAFRESPQDFYNWLRPLLRISSQAQPNKAHQALVELESACVLKTIITQNIDHLHQKAGSSNVIELHGSMQRFYCPVCKDHGVDQVKVVTKIISGEVPTCSACGAVIRPDITLYEEGLPVDAWLQAENEIAKTDLLLVAGSSLEVTPAALLPFRAYRNGSRIMIVNLSSTPLDQFANLVIRSDVAKCIPNIVASFNQL